MYLSLIIGFLAGVFGGIAGVGGGAVSIPAMVLLAGFSQHVAQRTSLLVMIPAGAAAAWTYWQKGNVEKGLLKGIIPGILAGTGSGALAAGYLPYADLRLLFAAMLLWIGVRTLTTPPRRGEDDLEGA